MAPAEARLQVANSNPNNNTPGLPSTPLQVQLWTNAQATSAAFSQQQDAAFNAQLKPFPLGKGSIGPGYYKTNGNPPNAGNSGYVPGTNESVDNPAG
jgi:hypothetical protein